MSETEDNPAGPRFPFVAALLCAACLGAAAWTWMRYSYRWDSAVEDIRCAKDAVRRGGWPYDAYVRVSGVVAGAISDPTYGRICRIRTPHGFLLEVGCGPEEEMAVGGEKTSTGRMSASICPRVNWWDSPGTYLPPLGDDPGFLVFYLDTTASRFTGASIAGLVVGAMGVFVFAVALRHWLSERRALRTD
ncbi:MAG: hypothetical protein ACYTFI_06280 [Planctomycetota bacterium]